MGDTMSTFHNKALDGNKDVIIYEHIKELDSSDVPLSAKGESSVLFFLCRLAGLLLF